MSLKYKHKLLIVDDEINIAKSLKRMLRDENYEIYTASNGQEGLECLQNAHEPFSLILSDQKMPKMTGTEFLTKAKKISPDAMRILLTGYSDIDAVINAINKSEIHRYFTKPWDNNDLMIQVRQMLEQYELIMENKRLQTLTIKQNQELSELNNNLEKKVKERSEEIIQKNKILTRLNEELESSLHNTVRAFSSISEINAPYLTGHARRVSQFSRQIALNLGLSETEVTHIEMAALLHDIGKIGFPEKLLRYKESIWTSEDKRLYRKHPEQGQSTVQFINRLEHVSILIRSHHENFDGTGFPDKLSGEEIPLGSKIIAVANAYDKIVNLKIEADGSIKKIAKKNQLSYQHLLNDPVLLTKAAITHVQENSFIKYDPDIIKIFINIIAAKKYINKPNKGSVKLKKNDFTEDIKQENKQGIKIFINDLKPGIRLTRSLYSSSGRFLIAHNTLITENHIKKLRAYHMNDPITECIHITIS